MIARADRPRVLGYPDIRDRNPQLRDVHVNAFLKRLNFHGTLIRRVPHLFHYARARQDEPYLDLAVAAEAHYLLTRDSDLFAIKSGHSPMYKSFRRRLGRLKIVDPVEFLRHLGHSN